jgi:sulfur-oxidizing protein SoxX
MTTINHRFSGLAGSLILAAGLVITAQAPAAEDAIAAGKKLAFDRKKGNCLACHHIAGGKVPGNIAPPLVAMKHRYPDKAKLRAQIADPTKANPITIMPPFGKHRILTDKEIDQVTEFVYSL